MFLQLYRQFGLSHVCADGLGRPGFLAIPVYPKLFVIRKDLPRYNSEPSARVYHLILELA